VEDSVRDAAVKRSIRVHNHKTSVFVEDAFWLDFVSIAERMGRRITDLASELDERRNAKTLSSAIRLFVLSYHQGRHP